MFVTFLSSETSSWSRQVVIDSKFLFSSPNLPHSPQGILLHRDDVFPSSFRPLTLFFSFLYVKPRSPTVFPSILLDCLDDFTGDNFAHLFSFQSNGGTCRRHHRRFCRRFGRRPRSRSARVGLKETRQHLLQRLIVSPLIFQLVSPELD